MNDDDAASTASSQISNATMTDMPDKQNGDIHNEIDDLYKAVILVNF